MGESKIEEVRSKVLIPKYIGTVVADRMLQSEGSEKLRELLKNVSIDEMINCILHKEKTPSMKVYAETNTAYCFACQEGGDIVELHRLFMEKQTGVKPSVDESLKYLEDRFIKVANGTIRVDKLEIAYDIDKIIDRVEAWQYDPDDYTGKSEVDVSEDYSVSEEQWNADKIAFINRLVGLKDTEKLQSLLKNVKTNKNGSIAKNRRNVVLKFGAVSNYNNTYGSHSYNVDALMVDRVSEFEGKLILSSYKEQSSF